MDIRLGYIPGAISAIAGLHIAYYNRHWGFGLYFEAKVAKDLSSFLLRYDPKRDGLWLLKEGSEVLGSIAIDGIHAETEGAHLRWFIVSDVQRGNGYGKALMAQAMSFCKDRGYKKVFLWTFRGLDAARHLYEKNGFRLVREEPGSQWGVEVVEQLMVKDTNTGPFLGA